MNNKTIALAVVTMLGPFWGLTMANAQSAASALPAEILACAEESDVMVRLSCYDREIAALKSNPPKPVVAPTPVPAAQPAPSAVVVNDAPAVVVAAPVSAAAVVAAAPISAAAEVPVAKAIPATPQASATPPPTAAQPASEADDFGYDRPLGHITAEVVRIQKQPYGELIIHLDNGQIWEQKHLDRRFKLSVGETVTVKKSAVAGYRLSGDSNNSIQVLRRK